MQLYEPLPGGDITTATRDKDAPCSHDVTRHTSVTSYAVSPANTLSLSIMVFPGRQRVTSRHRVAGQQVSPTGTASPVTNRHRVAGQQV